MIKKIKSFESLEAVAFSRYVRMSPFKVRRVLDQIRNCSLKDSLYILKYMPYKACPVILKVLESAVANSKFKFKSSDIMLFVKEAKADEGPTLKRFRPHAQGRGFPIKKRMCHITIKIGIL
jgi:large subunit ribosomal protein L22